MGKRVTMEANIKRDTDSNKFYVTFYYGKDSSGKAVRKTRAFDTLPEAKRQLKAFEVDRDRGNVSPPTKKTLNDVVSTNLELSVGRKEETTIYGYQNIAKHIGGSPLGNLNIQKIRPHDVLRYFQYLKTVENLSDNTIIKHYDFLRMVFNDAFMNDYIAQNVMLRVRRPVNKEPHEAEYYNKDECLLLLERAKGNRLELLINMALFYGLRREELLGLKWSHVSFEGEGCIEIHGVRIQTGNRILERDHTKSRTSRRRFKMIPIIRELLKKEQQKQERYRDFLKEDYVNSDYVFVMDDGKPYRPNYVSELFTGFLKRQGLRPIVLHELRHTFASLTVQAGVDLLTTSRALGHADIKMAQRVYVHLNPNMNEKATEAVENLLLSGDE